MVHPKDKVWDDEKNELIYRIPCKNCPSSYIRETGRKLGLRMKEHRKQLDSFTADTQSRAPPRAMESNIIHKSAITDYAVEENHVVDWDSAEVVAIQGAQRQTRWIKEAHWIRKTPICMNRDSGSYQLSDTWDQVICGSRRFVNNQQAVNKISDGHRTVAIR